MIRINLLPWREQLREQEEKEFFIYLGISVMVAIVLVGIIYIILALRISAQEHANQYLRDQITKLDQKIADIQGLKQQKALLLS
ncbi:pilus assembly protein PilN, partial [Acinetobacter baumannii]